jgi:hypothetical protein
VYIPLTVLGLQSSLPASVLAFTSTTPIASFLAIDDGSCQRTIAEIMASASPIVRTCHPRHHNETKCTPRTRPGGTQLFAFVAQQTVSLTRRLCPPQHVGPQSATQLRGQQGTFTGEGIKWRGLQGMVPHSQTQLPRPTNLVPGSARTYPLLPTPLPSEAQWTPSRLSSLLRPSPLSSPPYPSTPRQAAPRSSRGASSPETQFALAMWCVCS